ncbi:MAG: hypothetical protein NTY45_03345 [Elusimicrobia bacterium]|nr:hypothetical protein [Elusimicrobiota bacterium]
MKRTLAVSLLTAIALTCPAFAGEPENSALAAQFGPLNFAAAMALAPAASAPKLSAAPWAQAAQAWIAEVKKAYTGYLDNSELFTLPEAKKSELPPAALARLKKDNAEQHSWSAPYSSTAYKLAVKGRTAYVVQNERDGHSMTVHIYSAAGQLIAAGSADEATPLYWEKLDTSSGGYDGPGYGPGSGPDAIDDGSGNGPSDDGPDSTNSGGCGGTGSGGGSDPDGSGGGVLF